MTDGHRRPLAPARTASHTAGMKRHLSLMRWWWLVACAAVAAIVTTAIILAWPVPLDERVKHIRPGMTHAEVEAILYNTDNAGDAKAAGEQRWKESQSTCTRQTWDRDDGTLDVRFDGAGNVVSFEFRPNDRRPIWDRLGRRLAR
jgi:hypothetical protein